MSHRRTDDDPLWEILIVLSHYRFLLVYLATVVTLIAVAMIVWGR